MVVGFQSLFQRPTLLLFGDDTKKVLEQSEQYLYMKSIVFKTYHNCFAHNEDTKDHDDQVHSRFDTIRDIQVETQSVTLTWAHRGSG